MASLNNMINLLRTCALSNARCSVSRSMVFASSNLGRKEYEVPTISSMRTATKKAGGSVKRQNHNRKIKGKRLGPKVLPDELVQPGAILFRQKGLRMHPGRNVDYGRDNTLFALREGHVKITKELVDRPHWFEWGEGPYFERTFMHVEERPKVRRIVCQNPEVLRDLDT